MGACRSKNKRDLNKNNIGLEKYIYSINKFGSEIIPIKKSEKPLKFEIRLHNFRARGLKENKIYWGLVEFGNFPEHKFDLPFVKGPEPKFLLDKIIYQEIDFEKLQSTYMSLYIYSHKQSKSHSKNYCTKTKNNNYFKKKKPCTVLCIDLLTLVLGPEHHDINLIHSDNKKIMGRIAFDIQCQQLEYMSLEINSLKCKLNHCFKNELSFSVRYLNSHVYMETEFTYPVKGEINNKDDNTIYKWSDEDNVGQLNHLKVDKLLLSVNELRQCNLEIKLGEVNYELNDEKKENPKYQEINHIEQDYDQLKHNANFTNDKFYDPNGKYRILSEGMIGTDQSYLIRNETLLKARQKTDQKRSRNIIFKELANLDDKEKLNHFTSTNNINLFPQINSQNLAGNEGCELKSDPIHFEKIANTDRNSYIRSKSKKIPRENVTEKFDPTNEKISIKHERIETSTLEVKPHYNEVGYSRVNFYNVLAQQDNIILSQSSRVFHKFSYLYKGDRKFNNVYDNLTGSPNLVRERRTNSAFYMTTKVEKISSLMPYRKGSVETEPEYSNNKKHLERNHQKLITHLPNNLNVNHNPSKVKSDDRCLTEENDNALAQTENLGFKACINEKSILDLLSFQLFNDIKKSFFKHEILMNGNKIGELEGTISINHIPMIRQMVCGVHTERGLDISDNFLFNCLTHIEFPNSKDPQKEIISSETIPINTLPQEILKISELTSKLISKMINSTSVITNHFAMREIGMQVLGILKEIFTSIEKSHVTDKGPNYLIFFYISEYDLIRSQSILLELALNLIHMIDTLNNEARGVCCQILEIINEREEFSLSSMVRLANDLSQNQNDNLKSSEKTKEKLKVKVVEDYFDFTLKTLDYTLQKLSSKVRDDKTKNFIESFLAVAFMRLPKFQIAFLEAVNKNVKHLCLYSDSQLPKEDDHMGHLSTTNPSLTVAAGQNFIQSSENQKGKISAFPTIAYSNTIGNLENPIGQNEEIKNSSPAFSVIDWQYLFYEKLEKSSDLNFSDKLQELDEILYKKYTWQERISRRGLGFFYVVSHISKYVFKKLGKDKNINWLEMPGFKIIINSIIYELSSKEVHAYPKPLTDILVIFINDYGIMNKFYKTITSRTNVYDSLSVFRAIKILDSFFEEYERKKDICDFSYKFDYNLIKKSANTIFAVDHSVCVSKLIWLYYKNTHVMNIVHVHEIFSECFKPKFFFLFFHWSWQVRNIFYYFLWFIINHRLKNKKFITEQSILCKERLEYLNNKDDVGFFKAFNTDYPEELKKLILGDYYEKMRIIEIIRSIVKKEKLDPIYKNEFSTTDPKILSNINGENKRYIVTSINHYDVVEKFYRNWERENRNAKEIKYPEMEITPPKDDIVEYTSENVDAW